MLSGASGDLEPRVANPWRLHDAFRYVQGNEITPARWALVFAGKFATDTVGGRTSPALRATRPISSVLGAAGKGPGRAPLRTLACALRRLANAGRGRFPG